MEAQWNKQTNLSVGKLTVVGKQQQGCIRVRKTLEWRWRHSKVAQKAQRCWSLKPSHRLDRLRLIQFRFEIRETVSLGHLGFELHWHQWKRRQTWHFPMTFQGLVWVSWFRRARLKLRIPCHHWWGRLGFAEEIWFVRVFFFWISWRAWL